MTWGCKRRERLPAEDRGRVECNTAPGPQGATPLSIRHHIIGKLQHYGYVHMRPSEMSASTDFLLSAFQPGPWDSHSDVSSDLGPLSSWLRFLLPLDRLGKTRLLDWTWPQKTFLKVTRLSMWNAISIRLQCKRQKGQEFDSWARKIPWRKVRQPTPGFLSGESHGQWSLGGYSPWDHRESGVTE